MLEHFEQVQIFQWAHGTKHRPGAILRYPELELLHAIPQQAARSKAGYIWMYREGVRSGVPDIHLPVARGDYYGLWIELKRTDAGKPTAHQNWWIEKLQKAGHYAVVVHGASAAVDAIRWYCELDRRQEGA
jgi:hypothetical protein